MVLKSTEDDKLSHTLIIICLLSVLINITMDLV